MTALTTILTFVLTTSPAFSQYQHRISGHEDPTELAIRAKRKEVEQDERNIIVQQTTLAESELKAQKIRRQLEALSFMQEDEIFQRLQEYKSAMRRDLKNLQRQIQTTKQLLETDKRFLEESIRQLNTLEEEHKKRMSFRHRHSVGSPVDEYLEEVHKQNERLRQESVQRQKEVALQNLRLIEGEKNRLLEKQILRLLPSGHSYADTAEINLCNMLEKKVSQKDYDIAEINLLAAQGLPGAEDLNIDKALKTLDLWAAWVKHETERHLYRFREAPGEYSNSEAYFRILMMICVLQEDFKVRYHPDPKMRAGPVEVIPTDLSFFGNSQDLFVHGLTMDKHQGTCASLPVFYVAIGRRLGYPLKLVTCKGHLFVRWEDDKERFNIEGTNRGLNCYPDEEYMEWPWPISKEELRTGMYMKSLSPKRELAAFLELRSLCLKHNGLEGQHRTVKFYADSLRKKEGVDLDRLNQLMRDYVKKHSDDGTVESALLYQFLTNTNSWRKSGRRDNSHDKSTTSHTYRLHFE